MRHGHGRVACQKQLAHRLSEQVRTADNHGIEPGKIVAAHATHHDHRAGRCARHQACREVTGSELSRVDECQAVDILFRLDRLDNRFLVIAVARRQRQLAQDAMDSRISVQFRNQCGKFLLADVGWQRVLDRGEAAFLGLLALGRDIDMACRIFTNNHDGKPRNHAFGGQQFRRRLLDPGNRVCRYCLAINDLSHAVLLRISGPSVSRPNGRD